MKSIFFSAATQRSATDFPTLDQLGRWVEAFVFALFPQSGIEYWSELHRGPTPLAEQRLPHVDDLDHVAVHVHPGGCEGKRIEVGLFLRDGSYQRLTWAKSFGKPEECWTIARAVSEALTSVLFYDEIPEIVEMSQRVPKQRFFKYEADPAVCVTIEHDRTVLKVSTSQGALLDKRTWPEPNGHYHIDARVKDWIAVLKAFNAKFEVREKASAVVEA